MRQTRAGGWAAFAAGTLLGVACAGTPAHPAGEYRLVAVDDRPLPTTRDEESSPSGIRCADSVAAGELALGAPSAGIEQAAQRSAGEADRTVEAPWQLTLRIRFGCDTLWSPQEAQHIRGHYFLQRDTLRFRVDDGFVTGRAVVRGDTLELRLVHMGADYEHGDHTYRFLRGPADGDRGAGGLTTR